MADLSDPADHAEALTPSDTTTLGETPSALWIGGGGDLRVTMMGGAVITYAAVPDGTWMPIRVRRVWSTGTTASDIVGVWQ
jgi:hypothetical protein